METPAPLSEASVGTFAIRNCLEIFNRVILSYRAAEGASPNAGFIIPLGTTDMQLRARILVDGLDVRDREPSHSVNTFPLESGKVDKFRAYLTGQEELPISTLILANATLSLETGYYPLAVLQSAMAVELRTTKFFVDKLSTSGWSDKAIRHYEQMTLFRKLTFPCTDPRSLETYLGGELTFGPIYLRAKNELNQFRNQVVHHGYLPSHDEAIESVKLARSYLGVVS